MYTPKHFEQTEITVLHALLRERPLATVVTLTPHGLDANPIPLLLETAVDAPFGILHCYVARANPLWKEFSSEREALAIFHGPDAYITPSWYAAKRETGKVVPTWNYAVVNAHGKLRVHDDPAWLRAFLQKFTAHQEASFAEPWAVSDAPPEYIEKLLGAIVGIEIEITRLEGKWKVSQNQPLENRIGVVDGLRAQGEAMALRIADLTESAGAIR